MRKTIFYASIFNKNNHKLINNSFDQSVYGVSKPLTRRQSLTYFAGNLGRAINSAHIHNCLYLKCAHTLNKTILNVSFYLIG